MKKILALFLAFAMNGVSTQSIGLSSCLYNNGDLTITGGTFEGNSAVQGYCGGIYNNTMGKLTLTGGTITNNSTDWPNGGGVYLAGGSLSLSGTAEISGNLAAGAANNIYLAPNAFLTLAGDYQGHCRVSADGGNTAGTKIGESASKDFKGLDEISPDQGDVSAAYRATDTEAPYDILWMSPVRTIAVTGSLKCGETVTALVNGGTAPSGEQAVYAWSCGSDADGWTVIDGETGPSLTLRAASYADKQIKVTVTGAGTGWIGTASAVAEGTVEGYHTVPETVPAGVFMDAELRLS